jgi:hypothetical protein
MIQEYHSWAHNQKNVSQDMSHLHTQVYYSTIHNSQALETAHVMYNWWMD